ncbi:hypothetical protein RJT34_02843 [Clitoria ternatea]|uniref:Uncharacterized protein n=1 Tax=Clitoria ternatea TaxID=43366 RepID=A0AAN9KHT3_CLITE
MRSSNSFHLRRRYSPSSVGCKKYPSMELRGLFQYLVNQLKKGQGIELVLLQELIQQMANVQYTENWTEEQLDAMAGSETVRYQAISFGVTRNNKLKNELKVDQCEQSGTLLQYVEFLCRAVTPASNYAILVPPLNELVHLDPEVLGLLKECTKDIEGASVKNNKFCVSVHYRNVAEVSWDIVGQRLYDVLKDYPCLRGDADSALDRLWQKKKVEVKQQ